MKNKWKGILSKEIPLSVLKKTLALLLAVLMVVTSGDFSGLFSDAGEVKAAGGNITISETDHSEITGTVTSTTTDRQYSALEILGRAWNYGITSNTFNLSGDAETNFATKMVKSFPIQTGITDKAYFSKECDSYVGAISSDYTGNIPIKGKKMYIHTPSSLQSRFESRDGAEFQFIDTSEEEVDNYITDMMSDVTEKANSLFSTSSIVNGKTTSTLKNSINSGSYANLPSTVGNKLTIDLTSASDGTFFFDLDQYPALEKALSENGALTINKKSGQTIVFNSNKSQVTVKKYLITNDGKSYDSANIANPDEGSAYDKMKICGEIVCNFPSATKVVMQDFAGVILAPSAEVDFSGVGGGWIVADKVTSGNEWHFVNSKLKSESTTLNLKATKHVNNEDLGTNTPTFTFNLQEQKKTSDNKYTYEGNYADSVNNSGSSIEFKPINYYFKDQGEHVYRISEVLDNGSEYQCDPGAVYVKIEVSVKTQDNSEKTSVDSVSYYSDEACTVPLNADKLKGNVPIFNNNSGKGSITLKGHKTVNGSALAAGEKFDFELKDKNEKVVATAETDANGDFTFQPKTDKDLHYTEKDAGQTFTYTISEKAKAGYTADKKNPTKVEVSVADKGDGTLTVTAKYPDAGAYYDDSNKEDPTPLYNNTYSAAGTIELKGHKTVDGNALKSGEKFNFELKDENGKVVATAETDANGDFIFQPKTEKDLHYTEKDAGKTFTYTISEKAKAGYTPDDKNPTKVVVSVSDSRSGKLTVTAQYPNAGAYYDDSNKEDPTPLYNNTYAASGSLKLSGKKVVEGRALDKDFKFQLTEVDEDGNPIADKQPLTATSDHTKNGAFEFTAIDYHKDAQRDDTGLHYYELTETSQYQGYTDQTQKKTLTVSVTDNGDGTLKASQVMDDDQLKDLNGSGNAYTYDFGTYTNTYTAKSAALILSGNKTLTGADLSQYAGLFRFELQDASKKTIDTAKNDTTGRFTFAPLVFDKAGDYTYTISEINGGKTIDGIAYDSSVYTVKVTVTDNNEGQLLASASIEKDGKKVADENQAISFTNKKLTEITVNKNWNDNSNQEGLRPDSITLELLKDGKVIRTTKLSGTGDSWSYTFRDLEPANYTVHESSDSPYYEVDHNDQTADTTVTSGVNETTGETAVTLTNTFGRKVDVTAYKDLTGAKLLDGEFRFKLHRNSDIDSSKDLEAVNNADGTINFSDVDYDAKGYTVYELRDSSLTDISFDEKNSVDPASVNAIDFTKTGIHFNADGEPTDETNYTIRNQYRPIVLRVQKRSKSAPYDPLVNAVYGLYQVNQDGNDLLVESELSDANGYMYYGRIEPGVVYYFKEISAPAGHEVDPYPGQHFMVKYVGDGKIAVYDETGKNKLDYGDITESKEEKDKPNRTIQVDSEKTNLDSITANANEEKYSYSGNGIKAVATAAKGLLPEGTKLVVTKVDPKEQVSSYQSPTGIQTQNLNDMLEDNVGDFTGLAYYDISFVKDGKEVEPTGDVHVTLEPDQGLDLKGADPSDLKIIHIVESGEPEDLTRTISLVNGSVATDGKSVLQTSLTSDSFSIYALVDPKDSTLKGNYLLTAAGVGDFTAKLKVAKVDSSGNFIPNATLCVYKFDATKKDGLGEKVLEWTSADGVQDWQRAIDVEKPYVLVETNAPKGYKIADNIYFSIGKYNSALTCYAYDAKTGKLTESDELTQKNTNGSELVMVDDPIMVTTNYKTKVIPNHKSRTEDKVLYVPGSPKTGEIPVSMPIALPLASMLALILILSGYFVRKKKKAEK